jgi:Tfp pilus assembly protein PilO
MYLIDGAALGLCLAVTLGAYALVWVPLAKQHQAIVQQDVQLGAQRQKCSQLNSSMLTLKSQSLTIEQAIKDSHVQLEPADRINQRIADLTHLLSQCGLEIDDIQTDQIIMGSMCDLVPMTISGKGRYPACATFFHDMYRSLPDMAVPQFDLVGNPDPSKTSSQFFYNLFWFAEPSATSVTERP